MESVTGVSRYEMPTPSSWGKIGKKKNTFYMQTESNFYITIRMYRKRKKLPTTVMEN